MILGIQCCGFVTDPVHMGWLTNIIDRASVRQIVKSGTFLYQGDLAESLKEMFGDVVEAEEEGVMDRRIRMIAYVPATWRMMMALRETLELGCRECSG